MANDHYVAKTYLKHFIGKNGMLAGYSKTKRTTFPCHPDDVCALWNDDINELFPEAPNVLGQFRQAFERRWNFAIKKVKARSLEHIEKTDMSGYIANLLTCTPTTLRMLGAANAEFLKATMSFAKNMQLKYGNLSYRVPVEAIEAMEQGRIEVSIDPKHVQAKAIQNLLKHLLHIRDQDWLIVENKTTLPLITSDYPFSFYPFQGLQGPLRRVLPLTPYRWLYIEFEKSDVPELTLDNVKSLLETVPKGGIRYGSCTNKSVIKEINQLIAKCAEYHVFTSEPDSGIAELVRKYAEWGVEFETPKLPGRDSFIMGAIMRARPRTKSIG